MTKESNLAVLGNRVTVGRKHQFDHAIQKFGVGNLPAVALLPPTPEAVWSACSEQPLDHSGLGHKGHPLRSPPYWRVRLIKAVGRWPGPAAFRGFPRSSILLLGSMF